MAFKCAICGKGGLVGANVSHSHRVTKKKQQPNLQKIKILKDGKPLRVWVCTKCLKSGKVEKVI